MQFTDFSKLDLSRLPSPCFVVDEVAIKRNLAILNALEQQSGAKVLQALKAFSLWSLAPLSKQYLSGTCASGLHEAKLGHQHYGGQTHVFSPAYTESDLIELLAFADHIVFNSCSQLLCFKHLCQQALKKRPSLSFGLRINPEHSEAEVPLYDPCAKGSRLGITRSQLNQYFEQAEFQEAFKLISGFHFHTLCEQGFLPLERTLKAVEEKFSDLFANLRWINFGGGHHITAPDYQFDALVDCIRNFKQRYPLEVYLEPGEAIAIGSGVLVAQVLDICHNQIPQAILNTSATCHMPDTLEMPYRAKVLNEVPKSENTYTYRLGGVTCLAGDVIGDYSFAKPLSIGQRLVFGDMAHYTMVKTTTFNGTQLPAIAIWNSETDALRTVRQFTYQDFEMRLS